MQAQSGSRYCLAPLDFMEVSSFTIPPGACDTHAHVVSPETGRYPMVDSRSYTPPAADEAKYLHMLHQEGMSRGVLVQISVYGTDNRYMLEVLGRHPDILRGVAVVDPGIDEKELERMHGIGVRGLRINTLFGGGIGYDAIETLAAKIAPLGWHLQFLIDANDLPELMPRLTDLSVPCVIDHMGHTPVSQRLDSPAFQALFHLVSDHGWWVKLSGAYRISTDFSQFSDVIPLAQQLVRRAPDRMLWGSDWPHVSIPRMPDTGALRNQLALWVPDAQQRAGILVDNPARLYGFEPVSRKLSRSL